MEKKKKRKESEEKTESEEAVRIRHKVINMAGRG